MKRFILFVAAALSSVATLRAQESVVADAVVEHIVLSDTTKVATVAREAVSDSLTVAKVAPTVVEKEARVGFLPSRQRVDRNIDKNKFVYKGEVMLGLTASYGKVNSENSDIMLLLNGINVGLRSTTVRPFFAYSYSDNHSVGLRFGYEYISGNLSNIDVNLGLIAEGMENLTIGDIGLRNESYSWSLFHRDYLGLDRRGIIGVILETELLIKSGTTKFMAGADDVSASLSRNFAAQLNVNPGLGIYVFPQVCVTATVGIGGLKYNNIRQFNDAGEIVGRRDHSGLNFKINITNIQIGVVAHLWSNKSK